MQGSGAVILLNFLVKTRQITKLQFYMRLINDGTLMAVNPGIL